MKYSFVLISFLLVPCFAQASEAEQTLSLKLVLDSVDVDGADFDGSYTIAGTYGYYISPQWSLEATISGINDTESEWQYDNTGAYRVTLNSLDFMAGGHFNFFEAERWRIYARGGLLFYKMDIELDEEFYGIKAAGNAGTDDSGIGFYVGGGSSMKLGSNINLLAELQFASRLDVLDGSSRSFDVNTFGVLFGGEFMF